MALCQHAKSLAHIKRKLARSESEEQRMHMGQRMIRGTCGGPTSLPLRRGLLVPLSGRQGQAGGEPVSVAGWAGAMAGYIRLCLDELC